MLKYEIVKQMPVIDPSVGQETLTFDTASNTAIGSPINPCKIGPAGSDQVYARGVYNGMPTGFDIPPQMQISVTTRLKPFESSETDCMLDVSGTLAITTLEESSVDDITILPIIGWDWTYNNEAQVYYHLLPSTQLSDSNVASYSSQLLLADITSGGIELDRGVEFGFVIRNNSPIASSESNRSIQTIDTSLFARYCLDGYKIQGAF
jgi:hypothetical protein